jgi:hypothetical protein
MILQSVFRALPSFARNDESRLFNRGCLCFRQFPMGQMVIALKMFVSETFGIPFECQVSLVCASAPRVFL